MVIIGLAIRSRVGRLVYGSATLVCEKSGMGVRELLFGAVAIGCVAGYAWSSFPNAFSWSDPPVEPAAKATIPLLELPPSKAEAEADSAWLAGTTAIAPPEAGATAGRSVERSVFYSGCSEVRAAGKAPLYAGQPGYRVGMDGDGDGVACEPLRSRG
jgi:hypothetical protein